MEYTFIGYGVSSGSFKDHSGKTVDYETHVVVVQGITDDGKSQFVKTYKLAKGFNKGSIRYGQKVKFNFNEYGRVTAITAM